MPDSMRTQELLFVGRLVSDKGLDLLLTALRRLQDLGLRPALTVAGDGPERGNGEELARQLGVGSQVTFTGFVRGLRLAELMNDHQILVVPSRWAEPFGIVAIEGIACGCIVVGSEDGGLREAIGPCGVTFKNGSVDDLTRALHLVLTRLDQKAAWTSEADSHLRRFKSPEIASRYLTLFEQTRA
jgi:glycosyltransferase involved in cell wall biosynthesis